MVPRERGSTSPIDGGTGGGTGGSALAHTITQTEADRAPLLVGGSVTVMSTTDAVHSHVVTVACA
jgi:hypothetical protein